jgi:hypothetical protein
MTNRRERVASYGSACVVRDMYGRDKDKHTICVCCFMAPEWSKQRGAGHFDFL